MKSISESFQAVGQKLSKIKVFVGTLRFETLNFEGWRENPKSVHGPWAIDDLPSDSDKL